MLPEPALTFTIPSVHDGLHLDCRIYHPLSLRASPNAAPPWRRHAAVLAHPYAPLGGSYDDPILDIVGSNILQEGYLLATFNFRGAGNSTGKTSWTAKAERCDLQTVIAFLAYHVHHLDPFKSVGEATEEAEQPPEEPAKETATGSSVLPPHPPMLVIGGYSYGSLVATQLPPLEAVLEPFASPPSGSNEAQIRLRAASLAAQQNKMLCLARQALLESDAAKSPSRRTAVRVGGDEGCTSPRRSTDGHGLRSTHKELEEKLHELVAKTRTSLGTHRHHRNVEEDGNNRTAIAGKRSDKPPAEGRLPRIPSFEVPRQAYLLLSPIPGLASNLVTLKLVPNALSRTRQPGEDPTEAKLVLNPTLSVYGGADMFVMPYKARQWVARLSGAEASKFRGVEVPGAGHFWAEEGVLQKMLDAVGEFIRGLLADHDTSERE